MRELEEVYGTTEYLKKRYKLARSYHHQVRMQEMTDPLDTESKTVAKTR